MLWTRFWMSMWYRYSPRSIHCNNNYSRQYDIHRNNQQKCNSWNVNTDKWKLFNCYKTMLTRVPPPKFTLTPHHHCTHLQWFLGEDHMNDWMTFCSAKQSEQVLPSMTVVCICDIDLESNIFLNLFTHNTQAQLLASWHRSSISYNSHSSLVFVEGTWNSTTYIQDLVQPTLLPFLIFSFKTAIWLNLTLIFQQQFIYSIWTWGLSSVKKSKYHRILRQPILESPSRLYFVLKYDWKCMYVVVVGDFVSIKFINIFSVRIVCVFFCFFFTIFPSLLYNSIHSEINDVTIGNSYYLIHLFSVKYAYKLLCLCTFCR